MSFKIYNPKGVHTKDNPCTCKNCRVYPEFFHAIPYESFYGKTNTPDNWDEVITFRDKHYPDGIIIFDHASYKYKDTYFIREDNSKVTYNREEHLWYEADGSLHSREK